MAATGIKVKVKNVSFFFYVFENVICIHDIMILMWDNPRNDQLHLQHIIGNGMRHHHFDSMIILVLCIIWLLFQFCHTKSANDFTFMKHLIWIYIMNIMDLHYEFIKTITDK